MNGIVIPGDDKSKVAARNRIKMAYSGKILSNRLQGDQENSRYAAQNFTVGQARLKYRKYPSPFYSDRRLSTGSANAAVIVWKLIVAIAINKVTIPAIGNIHQPIEI